MWTVRGTRAALNATTVAPEPIGLDVVAAAALALAQRAPRVRSRLPAFPLAIDDGQAEVLGRLGYNP